ncbi:adducin 1-like protein hts isoform X4 [Dermatophagoides farinae]|uniref:Class II Aldolase and Adducin N-terminal domain, variant 3 n=1 Tax=Dermatophagoides farinae TaxID=6954 RepID=A0A922ICH6_DERFA|nr:protein hu-li tai shao-like isoform X4 [Dermatophagoides farinae]KAH9528991.1 Class II Aldolase and Adducin N-terminal domain, variant 3 [Dermatophagoides farinae]
MATQAVNNHHNDEFDPDDPEIQRQMMRPPDIEQDMKEMDRRRRVDVILNSQVFREELERIIESQLNDGYLPASLSALQQVTELLMPGASSRALRLGHCGPPINDIRGVDGLKYAKGEKLLRCKLASVYRLVDLYGWSMSIYNHITVRVSREQEHFLLNPFGLQYDEVTASSLIKVDLQGNVVDPGSTNFTFNKAGYVLHSAIHAARPDINAVIHLHYGPCVAVSAMKQGLMLCCQESCVLGHISYHDYRGLLVNPEERADIVRNLGPSNKVLILRNHGVVTCGESLEEAFFLMYNLVLACETQIRLAQVGMENIQLLPQETFEEVQKVLRDDAGASVQGLDSKDDKQKPKKWKIWDLEFEARMRMLDNAGFRTGYIYRQPLLRAESARPRSDVEVPPAVTSHAGQYEEDKWLSPLRKLVQGKRTQDKLNWVNSPNSYQKVEVLETGTMDPKKITKWVQDGASPNHSTPVKIDGHNQFVGVNGGDPAEFKRKQKEMKEIRMKNMISSGPQSLILEGANWDDARRAAQQDNIDGGRVYLGAASKGIIQRDFQHNATVYRSAYAKNPFDGVTEEELMEYRNLIERKQRGENVDIPEKMKHLMVEPMSFNQQDSQDIASPTSPTSPLSDEEDLTGGRGGVHRSHSARLALKATYTEADYSEPSQSQKESNVNGDDKHGTLERGASGADTLSREGSPMKEEKKKKKKGHSLSFFSKRKSKKDKDEQHAMTLN